MFYKEQYNRKGINLRAENQGSNMDPFVSSFISVKMGKGG